MWRKLWITSIWLSLTCAWAAPISQGPTSDEESAVLLKDGQDAFAEGRCSDAVVRLSRYVERYPSHPMNAHARLTLGLCLSELNRWKEAEVQLHAAAPRLGKTPEGIKARIAWARSLLAQSKKHEALLATKETEKSIPAEDPNYADYKTETLIVKAQAQLAFGREKDAEAALDSAARRLKASPNAILNAEEAWFRMELKQRECAKLPPPQKIEDMQLRSMLDRRATCLNEAFLQYRRVLTTGQAAWASKAETSVLKAYRSYWSLCDHPATRVRIGHLLPIQRKRYSAELRDRFLVDCRTRAGEAKELFRTWRDEVPPTTFPQWENVARALETWSQPAPRKAGSP